jgi:hypothetical protein
MQLVLLLRYQVLLHKSVHFNVLSVKNKFIFTIKIIKIKQEDKHNLFTFPLNKTPTPDAQYDFSQSP